MDYSNLNFKDAMVATGTYPGIQFPMVGGIDLVGRVMSTTNPHLKKGDEVLINGFGMGTDHWGGFAEKASVPGHWCLVRCSFFPFNGGSSKSVKWTGARGARLHMLKQLSTIRLI